MISESLRCFSKNLILQIFCFFCHLRIHGRVVFPMKVVLFSNNTRYREFGSFYNANVSFSNECANVRLLSTDVRPFLMNMGLFPNSTRCRVFGSGQLCGEYR